MSRILILVALAPLAFLAGAQAGPCEPSGGETVLAGSLMAPMPPGSGRAQGVYLYASTTPTDGLSGAWAETNGKAGLQVTDAYEQCGAARAFKHPSDEPLVEYLPNR